MVLSEFKRRGIYVVAISVDPSETSRTLAQKAGLTFPLLSDPEQKVIRPYDLLHIRGGPKGAEHRAGPPNSWLTPRAG